MIVGLYAVILGYLDPLSCKASRNAGGIYAVILGYLDPLSCRASRNAGGIRKISACGFA